MSKKYNPPSFNYCPICASKTIVKEIGGNHYQACPDNSGCKWVHWGHTPTTTAIIVLNKNNEVLLARRQREPGKDKWCLPGGFCEYGELPIDGAKRELGEETLLKGMELEFLGQYLEDSYPRTFSVLNLFKVTNYKEETPQAGDDAAEVRFFSLSSLPEFAFYTHGIALKKLGGQA